MTSTARLEHVNLTVSDPDATAARLIELFGWHVRWSGPAASGGYTVHVGNDDDYLAVYRPPRSEMGGLPPIGVLNHVALVVDDLEAIERRVVASGLLPINKSDYEPGRRFYFLDPDGIEFEIVTYS